jgi:hypothetical protein
MTTGKLIDSSGAGFVNNVVIRATWPAGFNRNADCRDVCIFGSFRWSRSPRLWPDKAACRNLSWAFRLVRCCILAIMAFLNILRKAQIAL